MSLQNHVEILDKLYGKAKSREQQQQADKRAVMARLPSDMLDDLRALHTAFGTRATWIAVDGETLLGADPERKNRVVPAPIYGIIATMDTDA